MNLDARADEIAKLLEERLGVRGQGLGPKLRRAGRRLPAGLRRELGYLLEAQRLQTHPRLARQIDWARIEAGAALAERHLKAIDPVERRITAAINWGAGTAFNLLLVLALLLAVLAWRGFV